MNSTDKTHHPARHKTERMLDAVLLRGAVAALSYRLGGMGKVGVRRYAVPLAPDKALARPLKIAFASDFHAGPTTAPGVYAELLDCLRREAPDVLLLGGDYVSFDARYVAALDGFLRAARAPLGTFAVIGNHDIWNGRHAIETALNTAGVEVLVNRNVALPAPFSGVSICGIDDPWTGAPSPDATFGGAGPVRIYLMHSPDGLAFLDGFHVDLGLAGHTHGGQIARRDGSPVFTPSGPWSRDHIHGRYPIDGNGPLIVSRGVGCAAIPLRLNADPELVIVSLG